MTRFRSMAAIAQSVGIVALLCTVLALPGMAGAKAITIHATPPPFVPEDATPDGSVEVEPFANQAEIPAEYRLDETDREFLRYLVPLPRRVLQLPAPVPEEHLGYLDNPIMRLPDGTVLTVGDLMGFLFVRGLSEDLNNFILEPDFLTQAIAQSAVEGRAAAEGRQRGFEIDPSFEGALRTGRRVALTPVLRQFAFLTRGTPVTEDDVRLEYERQKSEMYRVAFDFEANHIFLMGYQRYNVQEGDDLREIARRISGSELALTEIRTDDARRQRRWVPEARRGDLPFIPLQVGERLLVPFDDAGMERLAARALDIHQRLQNGEDFIDLAVEFSDATIKAEPIRPVPGQIDSVLPEIRIAIQETEIGEITPIIPTKHGYMIFQVLSKQEETFIPYNQVRPQIARNLVRRAQSAAWRTFQDDLLTTPLLRLENKIIQNTADLPFLSPETVLARFEDKEFTFLDLFWNVDRREEFRLADAEKREQLVREALPVLDAVNTRFAQDHEIVRLPPVAARLRTHERHWYARFESRRWVDENYRETTPLLYDFFLRYYNHFRFQNLVQVRMITRPVDAADPESHERVRQELIALRDSIESEAEFIEIIRAEATTDEERERAGLLPIALIGEYGPDLFPLVDAAPVGTFAGPALYANGQLMALCYVVAREDQPEPTFERVFPAVATAYTEFIRDNLETAYYNKVLHELLPQIEFLYPIP